MALGLWLRRQREPSIARIFPDDIIGRSRSWEVPVAFRVLAQCGERFPPVVGALIPHTTRERIAYAAPR
jgi:hypothetical protein